MKREWSKEPLHPLAHLLAAALQDIVEEKQSTLPESFAARFEQQMAQLPPSHFERVVHDILRVVAVLRQFLPDFDLTPLQTAMLQAGRRIAAREGQVGGADPTQQKSFARLSGQQSAQLAKNPVASPLRRPSNAAKGPSIAERLSSADEERKAKLAALADSMLAMCARPVREKPAPRKLAGGIA